MTFLRDTDESDVHETFTITFLDRENIEIFRVIVHVIMKWTPFKRLMQYFNYRLKPVGRLIFDIIIKNKSTFLGKLHEDLY